MTLPRGWCCTNSKSAFVRSHMLRNNIFPRIISLTIAMMIASAMAIGFYIWQARNDAIEDQTREIGNTATIIAEQVSNAAQAIDLSLEEVVKAIDRRENDGFLAQVGARGYYDFLVDRLAKLPQADVIEVTNADGRIVASTRSYPHPVVDLSDGDDFRHSRQLAASELFISAPYVDHATGRTMVYFSRRLETPRGQFLGVALIGVHPEAFVQTRHALEAVEGQSFMLLRRDGVIIMRRPNKILRAGSIPPEDEAWYDLVDRGGVYRSRGYLDDHPKYVAVRPVARYSLVVNMAITEDATLALWRRRAMVIGIGSILTFIVFSLLLRALVSHINSLILSRSRLCDREARISHMALHDGLTGLANRTSFLGRLVDPALRAESAEARLAVMLIDLDEFKTVNDTYGHGIGDELLREVGHRLTSVASSSFAARLGGDEFAILLRCKDAGEADAIELATRLINELCRPYRLDELEITIGSSIGIEMIDTAEIDVQRVMRRADLALYRAKHDGRNQYRFFTDELEKEFMERSKLAIELGAAVDMQTLELHYQPIVLAKTREIVAMEALLRWSHPERGMISPEVFVPLAEERGLIARLGEWVLRRACADAVGWPDTVTLCVNVSSLQIAQGDFPKIVERALEESGLPAKRLELEITESALLDDSDANLDVLHQLHMLGASIALDDFGTGYSSLSYLKMFPFDKLKIDKSFIADVTNHQGCAAIISATTSLARGFDIITTAEGVETEEQFRVLQASSVTLMQGYLFGRPKSAADWDLTAKRHVARQSRRAR